VLICDRDLKWSRAVVGFLERAICSTELHRACL